MAKNYDALADSVIELVGGKSNVSYLTHCVTRLRFNVKDRALVKEEEIKAVPGVLGAQWSGDQFQIIIGQTVGDAYEAICKKHGFDKQAAVDENLDAPKKKFSFSTVLDIVSGCIVPCIPVLIGAGMVKLIVMITEMAGLLVAGNPTHTVLSFLGDAGFYFLPVFIGFFTAKKFGGNVALGAWVGAMFIHPSFIAAVTAGTPLSVYGIPVYGATYSSTIFPAFLTVIAMCYIQKFVGKHSPDAIRAITEPLITMLIVLPLGLCVLGPVGSFLGDYIAMGVMFIYDKLGFVGVALFSALFPWLVMTGMHNGFTPYLINSFATVGYDPIGLTASVISNVNQGAASLAVALKTKDKALRSTAITCGVTAIVGGVTEPALFGVNFRLKTPLYGATIGSFVGAALAGLFKVYCYAFIGSGGIFALPAYIHAEAPMNVFIMALSMAVGMIVTFVATCILYKDEAK